MFYLLERINRICSEISKNIYTSVVDIKNYLYVDGNYKSIDLVNAKANDEWKEFKTGDLWGGRDCHRWFKCNIKVPEEFHGNTIALNFYTFEEGWDATNPQFIIYVNGEQIQGLDINHREIILTRNAVKGTNYEIDLHAYSGMLLDKKTTLHGKLVVIDEEARKLYWNLKVPLDACKEFDKEDKNRIDIINILNDAVNLIDFRKCGSFEYSESLKRANEFLEEEFYNKMCGHEDVIATCVGHTHIDVAWLWTVEQTREKVNRSFSTVLKLMDEYPEYVFMSSQPQLYKMVKQDNPKLYEKIKEKIKQGVWETEGGMWLEADCNVISGESMVRQIIHGKRFFKNEFGVDSKILWLPDVFGYSAAIPQILKKSGIKYFMTTKISWNQFNKIPNDTFMWKGIDGTEVLTHFITTTVPEQNKDSHFTTYNGHIHPDSIIGAWRRYQNKNINNDILISFGWGDGGGGATFEMLENAKRLSRGIPGVPKVKIGKSLDYFEKLENKVSKIKNLPKWVGELYLEYHRGTYTSMGKNKRDNRKCENLYLAAEKINSLSMILGNLYPQENINDSWEIILLNQFHDIIPGSSIKDVYDVTEKEYAKLLENVDNLINVGIDNVVKRINLKEKSLVVFNTLGFERNDIAIFEIPENIINPIVIDEFGNEFICQRVENNKVIFFAKNIPANGYKTFKIVESVSNENPKYDDFKISKTYMENKFFRIEFDDRAQIKSFINKELNREIVKNGFLANEIQAFEDMPMCFDNWDIDIYYKEKMWKIDDLKSIEILERGPVRATLKIERKFLDSTIIQKIQFYNDIGKIDFDTYIDWKEKDILVKVAFPVDINSNEATYEIQYGNVTRSTHNNTSWDVAAFEVCGHKWVDLSEGGFGVSILNDCKYGHDIKEGTMRLTLLKSSCDPNPYADKEEHFLKYSLYSHEGTWKDSDTVELAYQLNTPLFTRVEEAHEGDLNSSLSLVKLDKNNVMIEVVKKAEDSDYIVVRIYEFHNKRTNVTMEFMKDLFDVMECDLMEEKINSMEIIENNKIKFIINPFEIKSIKIKFK